MVVALTNGGCEVQCIVGKKVFALTRYDTIEFLEYFYNNFVMLMDKP